MRISTLAENIRARILNQGESSHKEINRIYAGDKMTDLLNESSNTTLLVTSLASTQLLRLAELMDAPGICLLNDIVPDPQLVKKAASYGTTIMVSAADMFETCGRIYQSFYGKDVRES